MTEENFVREREETEASWAGRMQDYKLDVQAQVRAYDVRFRVDVLGVQGFLG